MAPSVLSASFCRRVCRHLVAAFGLLVLVPVQGPPRGFCGRNQAPLQAQRRPRDGSNSQRKGVGDFPGAVQPRRSSRHTATAVNAPIVNHAGVDIEAIAIHLVRALVLGPTSYPILRELARIDRYPGGDILEPGRWHTIALCPSTWSSMEGATRYFHKLACIGMCSRAVYCMMEVAGGLGLANLHFRGQAVRGIRIGHGFVTHDYSLLRLADDFSNATWQYGANVVDNAGRVHSWIVVEVEAAEDAIILDLTAPQYDIYSPREDVFLNVVPRSDKNYRECYTTSPTEAAIEFGRWSACYDLQETEAAHVSLVVRQLQRDLAIPPLATASLLAMHEAMLASMREVQLSWSQWDVEERAAFFADMPLMRQLMASTGRTFAAFGFLEQEQEKVESQEIKRGRESVRSGSLAARLEKALEVSFDGGVQGQVLEAGSWALVVDLPAAGMHNGGKAEIASVDWRWGVYVVRFSDGNFMRVRAQNLRRCSPPSLLECFRQGNTKGAHFQRLLRVGS